MDTLDLAQKLDLGFEANQQVLQMIAGIDRYKGEWSALEKTEENRGLKELRRIATTQSIGSSTRIEGATLQDSEIETLLKNIKITKMKTRDEQEVAGYYEVLDLIYENYREIPLSENYVKQLHQLLLKYSTKDTRHRGKYKSLSNQVVATYPDGKVSLFQNPVGFGQALGKSGIKAAFSLKSKVAVPKSDILEQPQVKIVFNTTEPLLVESEMFELFQWASRKFDEQKFHPLLIIVLFIYEFLSIHPFQDGNGRLSRLLTTLCLLKSGYSFIRYISFENHIEANKKTYYEALMSGQRKRGTKNEKIGAWLFFFLESLTALTEKLEQKYQACKASGPYLNERQKRIRDFIAEHQPVKFGDMPAALAGIPAGTLKKDLQYLRREKAVSVMGRGKGTVYFLTLPGNFPGVSITAKKTDPPPG